MNDKINNFRNYSVSKIFYFTTVLLISSLLTNSPTLAKSKKCQEFYNEGKSLLDSSIKQKNELQNEGKSFSSGNNALAEENKNLNQFVEQMTNILSHVKEKAENKNLFKYIGATCKKDRDQFGNARKSFTSSANSYGVLIKKLRSEKAMQEAAAKAAAEKAQRESAAKAAAEKEKQREETRRPVPKSTPVIKTTAPIATEAPASTAAPENTAAEKEIQEKNEKANELYGPLLQTVENAKKAADISQADRGIIIKLKRNEFKDTVIARQILQRWQELYDKQLKEAAQQAQEKQQQTALQKQQEEAVVNSDKNDEKIAEKIKNKQPLTDLEEKRVQKIINGLEDLNTPAKEYIAEHGKLG